MAPSTESKKAAAAPATNGDAKAAAKETAQTPVAAEQQEEEVEIVKLPGSHGKPDPEDNRAKMDAITKQIEKTQAEVVSRPSSRGHMHEDFRPLTRPNPPS